MAKADTQIAVVAEGPILRALTEMLPGVPFVGSHTQSGECLVVVSEALVAGAKRRIEYGGLKRLQEVLANSFSVPIEITIRSYALPGELGRFDYLVNPRGRNRYLHLPARIPAITGRFPSPKSWQKVVRTAAEEELEIRCA